MSKQKASDARLSREQLNTEQGIGTAIFNPENRNIDLQHTALNDATPLV